LTDDTPDSSLQDHFLDVVARFRSQWTFLQYLEGIGKASSAALSGLPQRLEPVATELKAVSLLLGKDSTAKLRGSQREADAQLDETAALLLREDSRVDPAGQREFFFRVTGYQSTTIERLLAFYLLELDRDRWRPDEIDKVDFLATRMVRDTAAGAGSPDWPRIEGRCRALTELRRRRLGARPSVESADRSAPPDPGGIGTTVRHPDEISDLIDRFRSYKHDLGLAMLEPEVWVEILRLNWRVKTGVGAVIRAEEQLLLADLERAFALVERTAIPRDLDDAVNRIRDRTAVFERALQAGNVRLHEIVELRREGAELLHRLQEESSLSVAGAPVGERRKVSRPRAPAQSAAPVELPPSEIAALEVVETGRRELLGALRGPGAADGPNVGDSENEAFTAVGLTEEEAQLVVRLRRLPDKARPVDLAELDAAVLRVRLSRLARKLRETPDRTRLDPHLEAEVTGALGAALEAQRSLRRRAAKALGDERRDLAARLEEVRVRLEGPRTALWLLLRTGRDDSAELVGGEDGSQ
jgi:hypothetical protein